MKEPLVVIDLGAGSPKSRSAGYVVTGGNLLAPLGHPGNFLVGFGCRTVEGLSMLEFRLGVLETVLGRQFAKEEVHGSKGWHRRWVMRFLAPLICILGFSALAQTNLTIKLLNTANPVVGFRVPDQETNELTIASNTNLLVKSANQQVQTLVGCKNVMDVSWLAATNKIYHVLIRTNVSDSWTYTRIRIVGAGSKYHFYDFLDAPQRFYALSIE